MITKAKHIILSLLLLITTTGFALSKHYCGGELVSISLFSEAESCCNLDDCCLNEIETFQLDGDFSIPSTTGIPESVQLELSALTLVLVEKNFQVRENSHEFIFTDLPPPPKIQTALSKRQTYLL